MRNAAIAALVAALAGMFLPPSVTAQTVCGLHEAVADRLLQGFGERRRVEAVTATGALLEVFVSDSGNWTILVTVPGGPSCLVASGEGWQTLLPPGSRA